MTIHCRVIAFLSADTRYVTLWPWPFDLEQLSYMESHVANLATKYEDPIRLSVLELRVITFPVGSHWKCVQGHCTCAESRDPWVWGHKQLHIWNPRPRFAYSLYNFYWATTTIKGRLLSSRPMLKPFSGEKKFQVPSKWGQKMAVWEKTGVETLDFGFETPKRHFLARNRVVWRFYVKIGARVSAVAFFKNKKIAESLCAEGREITHAQNRNP